MFHWLYRLFRSHDCRQCRAERDLIYRGIDTESARDYANWGYLNNCAACGREFTGYKRSMCCRRCW